MNHEIMFKKVVKKDETLMVKMKDLGQHISFFPDALEKGLWCSAYLGYVLGQHGADHTDRRLAEWRLL